ncbi:MAG: SIMPL domain-containing protein [Actinomycetota bacterium]|nr:SIMPL domain-containing protein [Actinomycetota bacterium]MDQ2981257.1 SIMPL domain-containing protein [Actinomycetota bacterium]
MKIVQIGVVAALLAVALAFAGVGLPGSAHGSAVDTARGVTVTGTASVASVPNRASFSFGVSTTAATARQAAATNAQKAQEVIAALLAAGVAKADLQTQDVSVQASWSNEGRPDGFTAHSSVLAKVLNVARAGSVVDAAVAAGANETSGPTFDRSDRAELYRSALRRAFADARAKAQTLAGEADASLGRVLSIEELSAPETPAPYEGRMALDSAKTPVEPGTQEVQATVTVTFALG